MGNMVLVMVLTWDDNYREYLEPKDKWDEIHNVIKYDDCSVSRRVISCHIINCDEGFDSNEWIKWYGDLTSARNIAKSLLDQYVDTDVINCVLQKHFQYKSDSGE